MAQGFSGSGGGARISQFKLYVFDFNLQGFLGAFRKAHNGDTFLDLGSGRTSADDFCSFTGNMKAVKELLRKRDAVEAATFLKSKPQLPQFFACLNEM